MITLAATVNGHVFRLTNQQGNSPYELPSGSIQVDAFQLTFSGADWTGATTKKMVFWRDERMPFAATVDNSGVAMVPSQALIGKGEINVAVYGDVIQDNEVASRITTNALRLNIIQGTLTAEEAPAPAQSLFEQAVLEGVERVIELQQSESAAAANEAAEAANEAAEAANEAATAANAAATAAGATMFLYPTGNAITASQYVLGETIGASGTNAGKSVSNTKRVRTSLLTRSSATVNRLAVSLNLEGYEYQIVLYGSGGSISTGASFIGYQDTDGWVSGMTIISSTAANFALVVRHVVSGTEQTMSSSDITSISAAVQTYSTTDASITQPFIPADAKTAGDMLYRHEALFIFAAYPNTRLLNRTINNDGTVATNSSTTSTYKATGKYDARLSQNHYSTYGLKFAPTDNDYQIRVMVYTNYDSTTDCRWLSSWTGAGVIDFPADCVQYAAMVRKASGNKITDEEAESLAGMLSVKRITDTSLSVKGAAADAKTVGDRLTGVVTYPQLSSTQQQNILDLISSYLEIKNNIVYYYDQTRNGLYDKEHAFDGNDKLQLCCNVWADLIWGGVSPATFSSPSTYTGDITKAFNWGWFMPYMIRQRAGRLAVYESDSVTALYGYTAPGEDVEKSFSYTTTYSENGSLPNSQKWISDLGASMMACELYNNGYEIPISKADVGDLLFFEVFPSQLTSGYNVGFRRIGHVAVVIGKTNGFFDIAECGTYSGGGTIAEVSLFSEVDAAAARAGFLARRLVMAARHPAAFGVSTNVPSKFAKVNARY